MRPRTFTPRLLLPLLLACISCGSDINVIVRTSTGTIVNDASCGGSGGQFPLEESAGLVVTIIVTEDTTIVRATSGFPARCRDLTEGERASVTGDDEDGRIRADRIELDG